MKKVKNKKLLIVLAAGGTGGHIFPAQAVAEKLQAADYNVQLICDKRALAFSEGIFLNINKTIIISSTPKSSISSKLIALFKLLISTIKILWMFLINRPKLIISFGGYPTLPIALSAITLRISLILHEQNSVLGQINKFCLPFAYKLCTSFPDTKKINFRYKNKIIFTGLPLRNKITNFVKPTKTKHHNKLKILVIGGSQGTKFFSDIIPKAISSLDKSLQSKIQITQQVRSEFINEATSVFTNTSCIYEITPFFKNIAKLYNEHNLVITRAGASSTAELTSFQKAAIIIPFAKAKDNHQYYNAKFLNNNSKIIVQEERNFNILWLSNFLIDFLHNLNKIYDIETSYNSKYSSIHLKAATTILKIINAI